MVSSNHLSVVAPAVEINNMNTKKHLECKVVEIRRDVLTAIFKPEDMPQVNFVYNDCILMRKGDFERLSKPRMTSEQFIQALVRYDIVHSNAVDDPEGYDDGYTIGKVNDVYAKIQQILKGEQWPNVKSFGMTHRQRALYAERKRIS